MHNLQSPPRMGAPSEQQERVPVGVIGMGRWGRQLIRVFADVARVVVCANRGDPASVGWLRESLPGTRHTTNSEAVLCDPEIQAVVIATPIATHAPLAISALRSKKHVFVEKPLATSVKDCDLAIMAAHHARRQLFVGHTFLYDSGLENLRMLTRMDPLRELNLVWHKLGTFNEPLVWNLLTHEIAIALHLMGGSPSEVRIDEALPIPGSLNRLRVMLTFPGDRRGSIEIDRTRESRVKTVTAKTTSGSQYRWSEGLLRKADGHATWRTVHQPSEEPLVREVQAFVTSIVTGMRPISDGHFSRLVTSVVADVEGRTMSPDDHNSVGLRA